jgi:hypothetical protein
MHVPQPGHEVPPAAIDCSAPRRDAYDGRGSDGHDPLSAQENRLVGQRRVAGHRDDRDVRDRDGGCALGVEPLRQYERERRRRGSERRDDACSGMRNAEHSEGDGHRYAHLISL